MSGKHEITRRKYGVEKRQKKKFYLRKFMVLKTKAIAEMQNMFVCNEKRIFRRNSFKY